MGNRDRLLNALLYAMAMSDPYVLSYYMATRRSDERPPLESATLASSSPQHKAQVIWMSSRAAAPRAKVPWLDVPGVWLDVLVGRSGTAGRG